MAKKMTAGERITFGWGYQHPESKAFRMLSGQIDRAIKRAVKAEREKIHKLASDLCGIKDQKLPKTWGKIVTTKKRRPSKP